jgi:di/tricarboxylate transporter
MLAVSLPLVVLLGWLLRRRRIKKAMGVMNLFANSQQRLRELPRTKRLVLVILPLIFVAVIDMIKAYNRGNTFELIAVAVIFFVIMPFFAVWWDRVRHT